MHRLGDRPGVRVAPAWLLSFALASSALLAVPASVAAADTYVVDSEFLVLPGAPDGVCDAPGPTGCTLSEAIAEANADADMDTIHFAIPGGGVRTINMPFIVLPDLEQAVIIDGYTQPGASPNTASKGTNAQLRIVINGPCSNIDCTQAEVVGFDIQADDVTIRGLVLQDFGDAIRVSGKRARIQGNFIGTNAAGTAAAPNEGQGVIVDETDARIGGTDPAARNLISGNRGSGVRFRPGGRLGVVAGNLIGTQRDGVSPLGNEGAGVGIFGTGFGTTLQGVLVGGTSAAAANVIAFNEDDGVRVDAATINAYADFIRILRNSIFGNGGLAIDLHPPDGRNNDTYGESGGGGANVDQNEPVILSAKSSRTKTTVKARLHSWANSPFIIQFFSNPSGKQARTFIGQKKVTTQITGWAYFTFVPKKRVKPGHILTASATFLEYERTSELSAPKKVRRQ
jgi:trimeric autotransporter adhesin